MTATKPTAFMAIELDSAGSPAKVAMAFKERTLLIYAGKQEPAGIPQSWRQDLMAWDGEMVLAHPYPAGSPKDLAIRHMAATRKIAEKRVLTIEDMVPDQETRKAISALMVSAAGNDEIEEIAKAYQAAANSTPF